MCLMVAGVLLLNSLPLSSFDNAGHSVLEIHYFTVSLSAHIINTSVEVLSATFE